jgi:uncharacterized protein with PIN domain/sulfur carrier protein ThiS
MYQISLRFYEELNDFLPQERRKVQFSHTLAGKTSIKDVIEALGVPHTEVDLILVNQSPVDFAYIVQPGDRISVYPTFESFDISALTPLRPKPLREIRFVLDVHLGKLAAYLRFLGFDTLYRNDYRDDELARISVAEKRILLTRDRGLLKRRLITHGYYVRTTNPKQQLAEILRRFQLSPPYSFLKRCTLCNAPLRPSPKERVLALLPENTQKYYHEFSFCQSCHKIYWKGSHYHNMQKCIQEILN